MVRICALPALVYGNVAAAGSVPILPDRIAARVASARACRQALAAGAAAPESGYALWSFEQSRLVTVQRFAGGENSRER